MTIRVAGGSHRGRRVGPPARVGTRPTSSLVRNALFSLVEPLLHGPRTLDLFAGTGSLGIEALSRGASWADFVESDQGQCLRLRAELRGLGFEERGQVHPGRVERALEMLRGPYDLVLLDPPYGYPGLPGILERLGALGLVALGGLVVVEHSRRDALPDAAAGLSLLKRRRYGDTVLTIYSQGGG